MLQAQTQGPCDEHESEHRGCSRRNNQRSERHEGASRKTDTKVHNENLRIAAEGAAK